MSSINNPHLNKRQFPRGPFDKKISYLHQGKVYAAQANHIGEGGLSFLAYETLNISDAIVLNFFVQDGVFFSLKGSVKNIKELENGVVRYGVEFENVDLPLKRQLRAFIARSELRNKLNQPFLIKTS